MWCCFFRQETFLHIINFVCLSTHGQVHNWVLPQKKAGGQNITLVFNVIYRTKEEGTLLVELILLVYFILKSDQCIPLVDASSWLKYS